MKKLSTSTKLFYGFGFSAQGIKDGLFQLFLFFYFNRVLGLDPALAGTASVIALMFDAVSDPLVGIISDKWKSLKWGRRHPFMFASALPMGLFTWLLFAPPAGLSEMGLFWWLTVFTILVRLSLTLFIVPGMSLGAELTDDYNERTEVTSYRIMFGAFVAPLVIIGGLLTFFVPTENMSNGLFNGAAYPKFAMLCGILIVFSIVVSTWGTKHTIPTLPQITEGQSRLSVFQLLKGLSSAIKMKSYWSLLTYVMILYIAIGVGTVFVPYFTTDFFGLTEKELAVLPIASAVGGIISLFLAPLFGRIWDKKWGAIYSSVIFSFFFSLPFNLRILGWMPENGAPNLVLIYVLTLVVAYTFIWIALSLANSMMADVVDEYELESGDRQEGLFFSSMSFAYKCTVGVGTFIAGLLLKWIDIPKADSPERAGLVEVPVEAVEKIGWVGGPILLVIYLSSIIFMLYYPINQQRYQEIRTALDSKNG